MTSLSKEMKMKCEWFLNELEMLPADGQRTTSADKLLEGMPVAAREHVLGCTSCELALRDFADTRKVLESMKEGLPEAGAWFTTRVMASIRGKEAEIEELRNGVWISVRRLAPRLVAFAALLLVLGGTWALQVRRTERLREPVVRPAESMFETVPNAPVDDELVASLNEEQLP